MTRQPAPPLLRSWRHLRETLPGLEIPEALPIDEVGTTYTMTQELAWLDLDHFAVGRWDGSMSIFKFTDSPEVGPLISKAVNSPSSEGVQMITWIAPGVFATSNDDSSAVTWRSPSGSWEDLALLQTLTYDPSLGTANSGSSFTPPDNSRLYLLIGHANGFLTIWSGPPDGTSLALQRTVDVRSSHPVNPWGIHNVRGVAMVLWDNQYGYAVTGSEDGDLCVVRVQDGAILSRTVYNPKAQRGINSIATLGQNLLVANCSVGPNDKNLWYFWIDGTTWGVEERGAVRLQVDPDLPQVFNFDVIWGYYSGGVCFFSATEEGYLWMGTIADGSALSILGKQQVTRPLGAALGMCLSGDLAVAAYDLYEFNTTPTVSTGIGGHPERFDWRSPG